MSSLSQPPRLSESPDQSRRTSAAGVAGEVIIFVLLAGFVAVALSAFGAIGQGCTTGCGLVILVLFPIALVPLIIGLFWRRVWADRRFWIAFACAFLGIWIVTSEGIYSVLTVMLAVAVAPIPAYLLWQIFAWAVAIRSSISDRRT